MLQEEVFLAYLGNLKYKQYVIPVLLISDKKSQEVTRSDKNHHDSTKSDKREKTDKKLFKHIYVFNIVLLQVTLIPFGIQCPEQFSYLGSQMKHIRKRLWTPKRDYRLYLPYINAPVAQYLLKSKLEMQPCWRHHYSWDMCRRPFSTSRYPIMPDRWTRMWSFYLNFKRMYGFLDTFVNIFKVSQTSYVMI